MNCPENENVCSVKKENNLGYYRIHSIWKNNGFFLNITSEDGAWIGEMTSDDVQKTSNQLNTEPNEYLKQCKLALTSHDGQPGMFYSVENGSFTWKKLDDEDSGVKIKMGSVMLQPASFVHTIQNLVSAALQCNKKLLEQVNELTIEKEKCLTRKNELLKKLDKLTEAKNELENELYSKFILLLNTKKKKIKELEDELENKICKKSVGNKTVYTSSKNPYEVDTESDESDSDTIPSTVKKKIRKTESKTKVDTNMPLMSKNSFSCEEANDNYDKISSSSSENTESNISEQTSNVDKVNSTIPSTKDELLNFFYGDT